MTDRELLEMAAKAAGLPVEFDAAVGVWWPCGRDEDGDVAEYWNPLEDDGDAFRLAVKLGMEVYVDTHPRGCACTEAQSHTHSTPKNAMRSIVNHDADVYAATRRAIVIAAAEVGKAQGNG